jgi:hypothetical protein
MSTVDRPAHVADHFTLVTDSGAYGLAFATLEAGHPVDMSMFDKSYCYLKGNTMVNPANTVPTLQGLTNDINNGQPSVSAEPALQVCPQLDLDRIETDVENGTAVRLRSRVC